MKRLLLSAAALAAVLNAPMAFAAPDDNNDRPRQERANNPGPDRSGPAMNGGAAMQAPGMSGNGADNRDNDNNRDTMGRGDNDRGDVTIRDNARNVVVRKTVDRDTVLKFRANITAPHRFHVAKAYVRPAGFYPHRWTYGERLPRAFFAPDYFLLDFAAYGLIAPWDGYEWVRYGDDALLIDTDTGEVIRTEYDVFY